MAGSLATLSCLRFATCEADSPSSWTPGTARAAPARLEPIVRLHSTHDVDDDAVVAHQHQRWLGISEGVDGSRQTSR